jgi:hypothetical protein
MTSFGWPGPAVDSGPSTVATGRAGPLSAATAAGCDAAAGDPPAPSVAVGDAQPTAIAAIAVSMTDNGNARIAACL